MPTNQQRREAERRRLQRQLEERRAREAARRRFTLIISIVGTLAAIAVVVTVIVIVSSGSGSGSGQKDQAGASPTVHPSTSATTGPSTATSAPAVALKAPVACAAPSRGATSSYRGVSVGGAKDLKHAPKVTSKATTAADALECQDLVVGTGKAATASSSVTVQYTGVLYKNGALFDSSWSRKQSATFSLTGVVPGFTQGIGGTGKVAPMKVGGRRVMILPPSLGYGAQAQAKIPANSTLVFVVDLLKVA